MNNLPIQSETLNTKVGKRVRHLRRILNLSQSEVASRVSITYQQLQKYESGANNMSINMLEKISQVLDEEVSKLAFDAADRKHYLDILKLMITNAQNDSSSASLQHIKEICSFLSQSDAREINSNLCKLIKALEASKVSTSAA